MTSEAIPKEHSIETADPRLKVQFEKVKSAFETGHYDYTSNVAQSWVLKYPGCFDIRKLLRESQISMAYPNGVSPSAEAVNLGLSLKGLGGIRTRSPLKTLTNCEHRLQEDPLNIKANEILAETAYELKWERTCIFSWQTILLNPKRKPSHVVEFCKVLEKYDLSEEIIKICKTFLKAFPGNRDIIQVRDKASIKKSIDKVS